MKLESLLHYFHVVCKPAVADMDEKIRVSLLSNIDIVATGAVLACTDLRRKLTWCLLDNTLKFYKQIKAHLDKVKMAPPMASLREPMAMVDVQTTCIAMGMDATSSTTRTRASICRASPGPRRCSVASMPCSHCGAPAMPPLPVRQAACMVRGNLFGGR